MHRYVALLRAINVGGHTVKMELLREIFESLKFTRVETVIASGNVIFDTRSVNPSALETMIEKQLLGALGFEVATFIRTAEELRASAAHETFPSTAFASWTISIGFTKATPSAAACQKLAALSGDLDDYRVFGREIYWLCRVRTSDSKFSGAVAEKILGMPATFRNVTTVRKVAARL